MDRVASVKQQSSFEDIAKCLMMLSHHHVGDNNVMRSNPQNGAVGCVEYECKTCKRKFSSFQALGGHRASHKRPRLEGDRDLKEHAKSLSLATCKPQVHECPICGLAFSLGQALGGHMRRHRSATLNDDVVHHRFSSKVPVLKRSNSKRVEFLDLNLTPLENDLKLLFGSKAPKVEAFLV